VQCPSAGVEHYPLAAMNDRGIILTNAQGCYAPEIAEHVFALLLGLTRGVAASTKQKKWGAERDPIELRGMTMGIIGLGGIGRETARRAKSMDMNVIAVDAEPLYAEKFAMASSVKLVDEGLEELLKASDVVVSAAPHTPRSRGMIGAEQFAAMKKGTYFINVSRGKLVKTDAMIEALKSGHLAGAGLDVTDPEPLPDGHPLWDAPNVIITSHIAGRSQLSYARVEGVFADNVRRFAGGLAMLNMVDKVKGY
jgi:phosphoglycerate dehydrogenase-like enzyme